MGLQIRADGTLGTRVPSSPGSAASSWDAPMVMIVSPSGTCPACPDCPGRIQRPRTSTLSAEDETAGEAEHSPCGCPGRVLQRRDASEARDLADDEGY